MNEGKRAKVLAWVKIGHEAPVPRFCELERDTRGSFLVFQMGRGEPKHRQRIEHRLLSKVVSGQIQEVDYIYHPTLKLRVG